MAHPRERQGPRSDGLSRRDFLRRTAGTAFAISGGAALLEACTKAPAVNPTGPGGSASPAFQIASPSHPVTLPLFDDNPAIASGLAPETGATLQLFNWDAYIWKKLLTDFGDKYSCKVQVTTFDNTDEFLAKIRTGDVSFDVTWPTPDLTGKLAAAKILQPVNHSYLSNLSNVWPSLQNPFYDQGSRYTVPYTIYTTGIAYRKDHVKVDPFSMSNPYELFWDSTYKGNVYILDDYRESTAMVLLKNGITDINTGDPKKLDVAKQDLIAMITATNVKYDVNDYTEIPEGRAWIHQGWSGDMASAQYYLPKGTSIDVVGYWYPPQGGGVVGSDIMGIPKNATNPVLAHLFLDFMLDNKNAYDNMANFNGYQPPMNDINPDRLVADGVIPKNLTSVVVRPEDFDKGYEFLELPPNIDTLWHQVWQEFQAGG